MERDTKQLSCDDTLSFWRHIQNDDTLSVLYPPVDVQFNDEMFVNNKKSNVKPFIKFRNLNQSDEFDCLRPKPACEIGLKFNF
jgi:hypothetical protein